MSSVLPFVTWSDSSRKEISGATSGECRMCFLLENLEYVFPKIPFLLFFFNAMEGHCPLSDKDHSSNPESLNLTCLMHSYQVYELYVQFKLCVHNL